MLKVGQNVILPHSAILLLFTTFDGGHSQETGTALRHIRMQWKVRKIMLL